MVSKNNQWQHLQASAQRVPHYGLRKLSVGVASVLLSTTLYMGVSAHADTVAAPSGTSTPAAMMVSGSGVAATETSSGLPASGVPASQVTVEKPVAETSTGNPTTNGQPASTGTTSASSVTPRMPSAADQPVNATGTPAAVVSGGTTDQTGGEQHAPAQNQSTLTSNFKWTIHYTDEAGKKLVPDSVITHDYTRTDTGDQMGNWSYVPDSVQVTGTPNDGWNINNPTFKFDQTSGRTAFDFATWQAAAAAVDGYTPKYGSVALTDQLPKNPESLHADMMVDDGPHEYTFEYVKQPTKVTINYVDDEQGETVVGTGTVSGKSGTDVTITPQLPKGYMLTPNKDVPSTYTVTDAADQAVTIHVQKQFVDVSATDPQAKQTRTITLHYVYGAGDKQDQPAFDDAVLDVYYHRTATLDRATNQTTYGDWMWDKSQGDPSTPGYHVVSGKWTSLPQSWATVTADVPSIKGWYADLGQNDPTNTNHVPSNTWVFPTYNNAGGHGATAYLDGYGYEVGPTHTIKYVPNKTTVTVNYVDDDNNKVNVGSQHWDGTTGQHIDLTLTPPDNYVLTPGWVNPTSYDFDGVNSSWYTVHVKHKTQDVTNQEPKDQVTKMTRLTRNHLYGDGPHKGEKFAEPDIFDVAWKRTATKDLVTNKVTFGNWQVNWDDSKSVQGQLTARPVPYSSVDGRAYPGKNGYSVLGNNSHSEFVRADGSVKVNGRNKYGWQGVAELEVYPVLNYYYGPGQVNIPVVYIDADTGQKVAEKINNDALTGDDFRDGNTVMIDQSKLTSLPTTLTGYQLLPGQTLPISYKIDTFAGVKAIEVQVVKNRSVKVTFVDDDNKGAVVGTPTTITGRTGGDPVALDLTVPDKYELADGQQLPTSYTFIKGSGDLVVHLKHQVVQREATTNVYMFETPFVDINAQSLEPVLPKDQWKLVGNDGDGYPEDFNAIRKKLGTISGHVNYDLVTNQVTSVVDDWTSLDLQDQTFSVPTGDVVGNGIMWGSSDTGGKTMLEYMKENRNWQEFFADYLKYPFKAYLSSQLTKSLATKGDPSLDGVIVPELVPGEFDRFANERGDTTGSAFKLTEPINRSYLENRGSDSNDFLDQDGQLVSDSFLRVAYVYVPYIEKAVTRTINVVKPDGTKQQVVQTATLDKAVSLSTIDKLNWSTGEWASYDVPTIPGYTASQSNVAKETVTGTTEDQIVNITYTANEHEISVEYVNNTTGQVVKTEHVSGKTGQTVSITPHVPDGWELVNSQSVPSEVTLGADGAPTTVIKVQPQERSVTVKFVDDQSFEQQVGQAVTVTGRDGDTVDLKLTVPDKYQLADGQQLPTTYTFTKGSGDVTIHLVHKVVQREAAVDVQIGFTTLVDVDDESDPGVVVTQNQWAQLDDEIKKSYDDNLDKVDPTVGVVGTLTGHVNYDLVDNKVVSFADDWTSLNLGGQTYQMPDGTEVVNGIIVGSDLSWGEKLKEHFLNYTDDPDYINRAWHGYLSVNKSHIPSDLLVGNESNALAKATDDRAATAIEMPNKLIDLSSLQDVMGDGLSDFNEQDGQLRAKAIILVEGMYIPYVEKTATRTINVTTPDGKTTSVKQTTTLAKRVTGQENAHPAWTTGEWANYDVPTISGYTASQSNVAKETVTGTTKDQIVNITYTANPQTTRINYVDAQGKLIHTTTVNGVTSQTVKVPSEVPDGWKLVAGQVVPSEITFGTSPVDINYLITHRVAFVKSTDNVKAGDLVPGTQTKTFNDKVNADSLVTHASYTVNIWADEAHTQKLFTKTYRTDFIRNAAFDAVTGDVYYYNWSEGGQHVFAGFTRPAGNGYQAVVVPAWTATQADPTKTVDLVAQPQQASGTIQYQTMDGKVVSTQAFKSNNAVALTAPKGYTLMTDETVVTPTADKDQTYVVYIRPNQTLYTAADQLPAGVESLRKTVTRTIHITEANGHVRTITQRVHFTRTAMVKADGSVVYSDWQAVGRAVWNKVFLPKRHGYHVVIDGRMDKMNVTGAMSDAMVNVQYVKD